MKRIYALLLVLVMLVSVSACGVGYDPHTDPDLNGPNTSNNKGNESAEKEDSVYDIIGIKSTDYNFEKLSAREFAAALGIGWNLGNTFDATGGKYEDPKSQEVSWGNPVVTRELIQQVADFGYTTIRIPITWHTYCDADYNINPDYLNRIQEVVDYALDAGLFVIINTHHECEAWLRPTKERYEDVSRILCKLWSQIGDHFKDYDERLVFEGMNEPRVTGEWIEWVGNNDTWEVVNKLDLDFVETIRSIGGKNDTRFLMIPCYAATSNATCWRLLKFPENDDRVIVSVHAYTPYSFALDSNGTQTFSTSDFGQIGEIENLFNELDRVFLRKGRAVVIGEFGAMSKGDNIDSRVEWAKYYVGKAREKAVPCIVWDNGAFTSGETFGLIRRNELDTVYPRLIEAMFNTWYNSDYHFNMVKPETNEISTTEEPVKEHK